MQKNILLLSLLLNVILLLVLAYTVHRLGGVNHLLYRMRSGGIAPAYEHRRSILNDIPVKSKAIVFLGDSMTEYGEWNHYFDNDNIVNRGVGGDFTDGVLERLPAIIAAKPKAIFLMIGVNDLILHRPEHILKNYHKIVEQLREETPQSAVYLQSILPVNNEVRNLRLSNQDILEVNRGILALAKEQNYIYVNLHPLFTDNKGNLSENYTSDGIHLNGLGYQVWKNYLAKEFPFLLS